jgi:hypothetical protein
MSVHLMLLLSLSMCILFSHLVFCLTTFIALLAPLVKTSLSITYCIKVFLSDYFLLCLGNLRLLIKLKYPIIELMYSSSNISLQRFDFSL